MKKLMVIAFAEHVLPTMIAVGIHLKELFALTKNALVLLKESHASVDLALFIEKTIFQEHTFVLMKEDINRH